LGVYGDILYTRTGTWWTLSLIADS
jgi:hypothetical protein